MHMALSEGLFVSQIVFLLDVCAVYGLSCVTFLNRVMRIERLAYVCEVHNACRAVLACVLKRAMRIELCWPYVFFKCAMRFELF